MSQLATDLKAILGTTSGQGWLVFMDKIKNDLPFLAVGRPTNGDIQNSEIGAAGCKSWNEYIKKVLNWNPNTWRAWQLAFKIVLEHPYLRELDLTPSAIKTISENTDNFPSSLDEYNAYKADTKKKASDARELEITTLRKRLSRLDAEIIVLRNNSTALKADNTSLNKRINEFNAQSWFTRAFARP